MILAKNRLDVGWQCQRDGDLQNAEEIYRTVVRDFPSRADAWIYLGMSLNDQARFDEALAAYQRALHIEPENLSALTNSGLTLGMLGRHEAAVAQQQKALSLSPEYARAHTNLGVQLLRLGQAGPGREAYKWRTQTAVFSPPTLKAPFWAGETLKDNHLVIHGEQGLGDEVQTARYVNEVLKLTDQVTLTASEKLLPLFERSFPRARVVARDGAPPGCDFQICGFDLASHFGFGDDKQYLRPDPKRERAWSTDLAHLSGLKIGICWTGNPQNPMNSLRSIPLRDLLNAIQFEHTSLISLQAAHGLDELDRAAKSTDVYRPLEAAGEPRSIDDMAALISALDLVITCDSLTAHLAAALGIETWLLVAEVPDWRWGINGIYSPWYRNIRLFRQTRCHDWQAVCASVKQAVFKRTAAGSKSQRQEFTSTNIDRDTWQQHVRTVTARHGRISFLAQDKYIGNSLDKYGEYSEAEVTLFREIVSSGHTVVEAGANIGAHTIALGQLVGPTGKVFAFEPQPIIFDLLQSNIIANDLQQVGAVQQGIADAHSTLRVPLLDISIPNNFGGVSLTDDSHTETVTVTTIDALSLSACDFIKADVEGMETQVLKGAIETIKKFNPLLYLENDRAENARELVGLVKQLGYQVFEHKPLLYQSSNFYGNPNNVFGNIGSLNILCVPSGRRINTKGLTEI
ncbi:MAG: FkbM family methyltransferase [Pseudomonadota bacterium]